MMEHRIAIFAGHVGKDSGAIDAADNQDKLYTIEAVVTYAIACKVVHYLVDLDIPHELIVGGWNDRLMGSAGCTAGVDIHADVCSDARRNGFHCIYHSGSKEGQKLAGRLDEALASHAQRARAPHAENKLFMLRKTDFPCVIAELGFLSNEYDEVLLMNESYQYHLAWGVVQGLMRWMYNGNGPA
jgi:N-acetylmuramoyl-L-alanine amidase